MMNFKPKLNFPLKSHPKLMVHVDILLVRVKTFSSRDSCEFQGLLSDYELSLDLRASFSPFSSFRVPRLISNALRAHYDVENSSLELPSHPSWSVLVTSFANRALISFLPPPALLSEERLMKLLAVQNPPRLEREQKNYFRRLEETFLSIWVQKGLKLSMNKISIKTERRKF